MIKAVIFDFTQTLVDSANGFRLAEKQAEQKIFEDLKLPSWQDFIGNYRKVRSDFKTDFNFSRISLWKEIYTIYNRQCDQKLLEEWELNYWENVRDLTKAFPETGLVLAKLHARYRLAVITNIQGQRESGTHLISLFPEIQNHLDTLIVAGELDIPPKPHLSPFLQCLEKLEISNMEAVFVGDDWYIDIVGAINAGIRPVWLKHHLVKRNWPDIEDTVPIITDLGQLIDSKGILNFYLE